MDNLPLFKQNLLRSPALKQGATILACVVAITLASSPACGDTQVPESPGGKAAVTIPLYDSPVAATERKQGNAEIDEEIGGNHVVRNVTVPTLSAWLPDPAAVDGASVIIAPGGAFMMLSIDYEGNEVARRLAARGVAAFVLKYRLEQTPRSDVLFAFSLAKMMHGVVGHDGIGLPTLPGEDAAVEDGLQAMRLVKRRAAEWGLDPKRIGFMGFSAGAIVAVRVATEYDATSRPAFVAPIYGLKNITRPLPMDVPPLFFAVAADDPIFGKDAPLLYDIWRKAGAPVELHVYDKGGHGFGMKQQHLSSDHWIDEFGWWLESRGLLLPARH